MPHPMVVIMLRYGEVYCMWLPYLSMFEPQARISRAPFDNLYIKLYKGEGRSRTSYRLRVGAVVESLALIDHNLLIIVIYQELTVCFHYPSLVSRMSSSSRVWEHEIPILSEAC